MKKMFLAAFAAVVVAASAHAQSTVDSIASKYKLLPMPGALTLEQKFPVIGNYQLDNSTEGTGTLNVMLDSSNRGIVWVDGLPQGKVKAYLKKSPSTYRILPQKTSTGKQIQEGTLHYDTTTHSLHVAIGKAYDEMEPTAIFASAPSAMSDMNATAETVATTETKGTGSKTKSKSANAKTKAKVQYYSATKIIPEALINNTQQLDSTQQVSDSTNQQ